MMTLEEALGIVTARRETLFGDDNDGDGTVRIRYSDSPDADRALFSGYDVDYDELIAMLDGLTGFFCNVSLQVGLVTTIRAALAEALQIGLVKGADSARS